MENYKYVRFDLKCYNEIEFNNDYNTFMQKYLFVNYRTMTAMQVYQIMTTRLC